MNARLAVFPAELKAALDINGVQYKRPVTVTATVTMDTVNCDTPWINAGVYTWYLAQCLVLSKIQGTKEGTDKRTLSPWHLSGKKSSMHSRYLGPILPRLLHDGLKAFGHTTELSLYPFLVGN